MIFSKYKENFEVLLDYPKIGWEDIKYYDKKAVMNLLHSNIDVHSRRLIAKFPGDGDFFFKTLVTLCKHDFC